jgi:uncharacterized protein YcfJ
MNMIMAVKENNQMLKNLVLITPLLAMAAVTEAAAEAKGKVRNAEVSDRFTEYTVSEPYTKSECVMVDVPIYESRVGGNKAAEGALLGMILGGLAGKGITGNDKGAAAGAIFGGLVGADKGGNKPNSEKVVTGYRTEERCTDVTYYREVTRTEYSHSVITFNYNGLRYALQFDK